MKLQIGKERMYNPNFGGRNDVVGWDVQKITDGQNIKVTFISVNSPWRQGIRLATDKGIEVAGQVYPGVLLWHDNSPKEVICKCFTKDGNLSIYNIWNEGRYWESQSDFSGMLLEEKGNVITYHCNDVGLETNFDKLVFSIEKL